MIEIKDERDIQDAIEEINSYLEKRGSALKVAIFPAIFAEALTELLRNETVEALKITKKGKR